MLTSHPRVVAYSELFMHGGEGKPKWSGAQDLPYWQTYSRGKHRLTKPYWLLHYLGEAYREREGVDAIGFKLMYSQLTRIARPLMPALWLKRVRIIHLIRRNARDVVLEGNVFENNWVGADQHGIAILWDAHSIVSVAPRLFGGRCLVVLEKR